MTTSPQEPPREGTAGSEHADNEPLEDYDSLSAEEIAARAEVLDRTGVTGLLRYEREHADRSDVVSVLERRLAQL